MTLSNPFPEAAAGARDYVARLLALLGDRDPMAVMQDLVPALRGQVAGMDARSLRTPEAPGKWSALEALHHLADSELVYRYRMRLIVAQPGGSLPGYDQDAWARRLRYNEAGAEEALTLIDVLRRATLDWLGSLSDAEWELEGVHAERGTESVERIVQLLAAHDLVHRHQIDRIKAAVGG